MPDLNASINVEISFSLIATAAVWPLILAPNLPLRWDTTLETIASVEVTDLVKQIRFQRALYERQGKSVKPLAQLLAEGLNELSCRGGAFHLLEDMCDMQRGGQALSGFIIAHNPQSPSPTPQDMPALLRFLLWVGSTGAAGVIGNRIDAFVMELASHVRLQPTPKSQPAVSTQPVTGPVNQPESPSTSIPQEIEPPGRSSQLRSFLPYVMFQVADSTDPKLKSSMAGFTPRSTKFAPDGQILATVSSQGLLLQLWRVEDGRLLHTLGLRSSRTDKIVFSPDGRILATLPLYMRGSVQLWRVDDGRLLHTLAPLENETPYEIAFSPDGRILATRGPEVPVRLWQVDDGHLLHALGRHDSKTDEVAFSPDGRILATMSYSKGRVQLWQVDDGRLLHTLGQHDRPIRAAFSPDGRILATMPSERPAQLWQVDNGRLLHTLQDQYIAFAPDGCTMATTSPKGPARLWRVDDGRLLHTLSPHGTNPA